MDGSISTGTDELQKIMKRKIGIKQKIPRKQKLLRYGVVYVALLCSFI